MGGKSSTIATSEPRLGTLRVQTSMYGLALPLMWGQPRVTGNLLWFGNFKAIAQTTTEEQGGKGGGSVKQVNTTYSYYAAAMLALGRGPINGIASAWKDKQRYSGADVPGPLQTLHHTVTIPAAGATIAVPLNGGAYRGHVGAIVRGGWYFNDYYYDVIGLTEGLEFTQDGNGNYTFAPAPEDREVTIDYQATAAGTRQSALGQLGLSLADGRVGQPVWSWLATFAPDQALAYSGTAYVYAEAYPLTNQAEVENHSFEVITGSQVGSGVVDADPAEILQDFLINPYYGVGWKPGRLSSLQRFRSYVRARQLWLSPVMNEQRPARDWMQALAEICNAEWVFQGEQLDLVPRGDEALSSPFGSFTPITTPVFDLVHGEGGDILEPVEVIPVVNEDAKNIIRIEYTNRANGYAIEIMEARDAAHIELFGERPAEVRKMTAIHDAGVAQGVCQQILQREMTVWNRYRFQVPFSRALIALMDLVTLTDPDSDLARAPVRVTSRSEQGTLIYEYEAEDAPIGAASAPLYGQQSGQGFAHDYNASPGNVAQPFFFEPPKEYTTTGLEVWLAVTGLVATWGGCTVWASTDGLTYKAVGRVAGGARYGDLSAALGTSGGDTLGVALTGLGGTLLSGSASDAATGQTLLFVGDVNGGEYLSYQTATLTGTNAYDLTGLSRGSFYSAVKARAAHQASVVRIDSAIARSEPLQPSQVGQPLYFKFTSFNVYGGGEQALEDVQAYAYTPTGYMFKLPPPAPAGFNFDGARTFTWPAVSYPRSLLAGYEIRFQYGTNQSYDDAVPLQSDVITDNPYIASVVPQGPVTFMLRTVDVYGNRSASGPIVAAQLGDPLTDNVVQSIDFKAQGWPGVITGAAGVSGGNIVATNGASAFGSALQPAFSAISSDPAFSATYAGISYTTTAFTPATAGRMTLLHTVLASQYQVNYRPVNPAPAFAGSGSQAAFPQGSSAAAFAAQPAWQVWPGEVQASVQPYQLQVVCGVGTTQQQITRLTAQVDVPDVFLRLSNVAISAAGTRLAAAVGKFTAITNIGLTLQGGSTAVSAQFTDRSATLGPNVICLDAALAQTSGVVDANLQGYYAP